MNGNMNYSTGFLLTTALLLLQHLALYAPLRPRESDTEDRADRKVLAKFFLGVGAILAGCAAIRWQSPNADPFLTPLACSAGGLVVAAGYAIRAAIRSAWVRGWLTGLADKGELADEPARERDDKHA
jgi:hypothetical protein